MFPSNLEVNHMPEETMRPKAVLMYDYPRIEGDVFGRGRRERIAGLTDLYPPVVHTGNFDEHAANLSDVEVIFATWGMIRFSEAHFARMPKLKAVFYAAGNVRAFADPLVDNGVLLAGAWDINAIPTSQICLAQTLLSLRTYFRAVREYGPGKKPFEAKNYRRAGINGETVGLIGMGKIGTRFRNLLAAYPIKVIAHDPFLTEERALDLQVERVSLEQIFQRALVVSNHIPDLPSTRGTLTGDHFASLREGATFINTGRGAQVVEADMIRVLTARPDLTALLEVTDPEPPAADSPLWDLPNVVISPHTGGTVGDEVVRLSDCAIEEFEAWIAGRPLRYEITAKILETMG
jgi:phosphoglycerate dehydrogenase-like enzyme